MSSDGGAEVGQVAGDAGVDDRDADAAAGPAVGVPQVRRLDRRVVGGGEAVARGLRLGRGVQGDRADLGARGELAGAGGGQLGGDGVDDVQVTRDLAPQLADERRGGAAGRARVRAGRSPRRACAASARRGRPARGSATAAARGGDGARRRPGAAAREPVSATVERGDRQQGDADHPAHPEDDVGG